MERAHSVINRLHVCTCAHSDLLAAQGMVLALRILTIFSAYLNTHTGEGKDTQRNSVPTSETAHDIRLVVVSNHLAAGCFWGHIAVTFRHVLSWGPAE